MKTFDELNKKFEDFEKKFTEEGKTMFNEIADEIFEKFPEVDSFTWSQYTPYFNDGDECTFRVNEVHIINGFDEYDDEKDPKNIFLNYSWKEAESDPRAYEVVGSIKSFIESAPQGIMRALFGDHVQVTITREGIETKQYDHD